MMPSIYELARMKSAELMLHPTGNADYAIRVKREKHNRDIKEWYKANKDKRDASARKYRETHREEIRERGRAYYHEHKEMMVERQRKYRLQRTPEQYRKHLERCAEYKKKNTERYKAMDKERYERIKADPVAYAVYLKRKYEAARRRKELRNGQKAV